MSMSLNSAVTPAKLGDTKIKFNIPIYQRLFVWGEAQIEQLLSDLKKAHETNPSTPYYIGVITVVANKGGTDQGDSDQEEKWDIVDGQQRLTFLTLFGAYMCCCVQSESCEWEKFIFSDDKTKLRINYFGRPEDEEDLLQIRQGKFSEVKNPNFLKFIACMERQGANAEFAMYVYNYASFLISELPESYNSTDLNRFFEKMNAAGQQLTPVEQIKGKYFPHKSAIFDACLNFEHAYQGTNSSCTKDSDTKGVDVSLADILKKKTSVAKEPESTIDVERYSNRLVLRPAIFLLHVLKITLRKDKDVLTDENKILETFSKYADFEKGEFIKNMTTYRKWMDANIIYLKRSDSDNLEYAFREEDTKDSSEDTSELLKKYQSMLYVSSSSWQEWVLTAYQSGSLSLGSLKQQDAKRHPWPPNAPAMTYQNIQRYWFLKLDYILWELVKSGGIKEELYHLNKDEITAIKNYLFRTNRSIEHLHPQTSTNAWEDDTTLHSFGNLAMISSSFNSAQSNDSVGVKFARVSDTQVKQSKLESIKMLLMFRLAGGKEAGWTKEIAKEHQKAMFELLSAAHQHHQVENS